MIYSHYQIEYNDVEPDEYLSFQVQRVAVVWCERDARDDGEWTGESQTER